MLFLLLLQALRPVPLPALPQALQSPPWKLPSALPPSAAPQLQAVSAASVRIPLIKQCPQKMRPLIDFCSSFDYLSHLTSGVPRGRFLWQQDQRSLATKTVPVAHWPKLFYLITSPVCATYSCWMALIRPSPLIWVSIFSKFPDASNIDFQESSSSPAISLFA